jgi:hypothetical protein
MRLIALYIGWIVFVLSNVRRIHCQKNWQQYSKYIFAIIIVLAPLYSILIYPFIAEECKKSGGIIQLSKFNDVPRNIVIQGNYNKNRESKYSLTPLLASETIDALYFEKNADLGYEYSYIKSSAEIYEDFKKPYLLDYKLFYTDPSDITCGPFYRFITRYPDLNNFNKNKCIGISQGNKPKNYLRISKTEETKTIWQTFFYPIKWEITKIVLVDNEIERVIQEIRSFKHEAIKLLIGNKIVSIADYACEPKSSLIDIILDLVKAKKNTPNGLLSKEAVDENILKLTEKYFDFKVPDEVTFHEVHAYNHEKSIKAPLWITLNLAKNDKPLWVRLHGNVNTIWEIKPFDKKQFVFVELFVPKPGTTVIGIEPKYVFSASKNEFEKEPLKKFFFRQMRPLLSKALNDGHVCKYYPLINSSNFTIEVKEENCLHTDPPSSRSRKNM